MSLPTKSLTHFNSLPKFISSFLQTEQFKSPVWLYKHQESRGHVVAIKDCDDMLGGVCGYDISVIVTDEGEILLVPQCECYPYRCHQPPNNIPAKNYWAFNKYTGEGFNLAYDLMVSTIDEIIQEINENQKVFLKDLKKESSCLLL